MQLDRLQACFGSSGGVLYSKPTTPIVSIFTFRCSNQPTRNTCLSSPLINRPPAYLPDSRLSKIGKRWLITIAIVACGNR